MATTLTSLPDSIPVDFLHKLNQLTTGLISTLTDRQFYMHLYTIVEEHVRAHPWATASLVAGLIMVCNPIAMMGFGQIGPVAGSLAATWQSTMGGSVATGSLFAILQSWGMMSVAGTIIAIGSIVTGISVVAAGGNLLTKIAHAAQEMASTIGIQLV
ncbi:hypothetical protein BDN72DRAFT_846986 [Pluteus cervinus]|uniref:Uncharacterized protein n=1 Tax=Pluteus cervinus TaxID=181527 RepID=A0ACD3AEL1_9AGAR|nr:hypothetical protein BDN72DRAFT_846986 [Pluteus cervinus]